MNYYRKNVHGDEVAELKKFICNALEKKYRSFDIKKAIDDTQKEIDEGKKTEKADDANRHCPLLYVIFEL